MRQEHEGCMCIANVIPSHQMAWLFFRRTNFSFSFSFFFLLFPRLLLLLFLLLLHLMFSSLTSPFFPPLSPLRLDFPRTLRLRLHLSLLIPPRRSSSVPHFSALFHFLSPSPSCALKQDSLSSINGWGFLHSNSWLQSSILHCWSARSRRHRPPSLSCYLRGCLISQIACVSDIRLTCFLCSGLFLKKKAHLIELMLWAQSGGARLSDGRTDCNAPQHVSNTAATPWAEFQDREYCTPPRPPPPPSYLTCCPWANTHVGAHHEENQSGELTVEVFSVPRLVIKKDH